MKLSELLVSLDILSASPGILNSDREITSICFDSRQLQAGCLFVAIRGTKSDGHEFLSIAAERGAAASIVERGAALPPGFAGLIIEVANCRRALNQLAAAFYQSPAKKIFMVGVTGTNGKTTITNMVEAILNGNGCPTGVIGTIDLHLGSRIWPTELTTPDSLSLQRTLSEFLGAGAKAVAMEVSSIGLVQCRSDEVPFDVAIFTNLTRDHLDFHGDMETYYQAKRKLFIDLLGRSPKNNALAIINGDDDYGRRLLGELKTRAWSYGVEQAADLKIELLDQGFFGSRFRLSTVNGNQEFRIRQPGLHNVYNAVAAVGAGLAQGATLVTAAAAMAQFGGVRGRLEAVENHRGIFVFVDYAHTDDALVTVLRALGQIRDRLQSKNRIITVFGCGGDRDRGKRPLMMKAASDGSDLVIVTSDNPRTEDPEAIVRDALKGATPSDIDIRVFSVVDRRKAMTKAISLANPGDVVLIAGKGHENYQQIGAVKYPFSDVDVAREIMQ